ncbi:MAG: serine/threonine-protein kinase, partial [Anaerolineae bacterium]|nr:serine/threonine-protein kinase [Anaerolineae bacterium]
MSELNPFQPGAQLGRYEIVRPLGKGGMGQVYLARDGMLQREVVIKTLSREVSDQAVLERWRREILTMARVNHPNVISIYDAEFGGGALGLSYIVMEYAALGSLQDELEHLQGRATMMAVAQVLEIGIQVAQALCAVHGAGVIHRDIKPSNILITRTPEGRVIYKLADFGIAIASDLPRVTSTHSSLLTPLFAAPEQFASSKVDERADIYSLGATLWDC